MLALLSGDIGTIETLATEHGDDPPQAVINSFFVLLTRRRFPRTNVDVRDITKYVAGLGSSHMSASRRRVEAVIRSALGEPHLAQDMSTLEYFEVMVPLIQLFAEELSLTVDEIYDLLREAEEHGFEIMGMPDSGSIE